MMSDFLNKWGNWKATPTASPTPTSESGSGTSEGSWGSMANKLRGKDPNQKEMDFYLSKKEQEEAKAKASSTTEDILDVIDNIQRPFYAFVGGIHEGVKSYKEDEPFSKSMGDIKDAMVKGWNREERKNSRDVAKLINPESVDWIEKNTTVKMFGTDALNPDIGTVPFLAADILLDPITYV